MTTEDARIGKGVISKLKCCLYRNTYPGFIIGPFPSH